MELNLAEFGVRDGRQRSALDLVTVLAHRPVSDRRARDVVTTAGLAERDI
jgi:hypothetical protein